MIRTLILAILTSVILSGCGQYKCIDGKVYFQIGSVSSNHAWIEAESYRGTPCLPSEESK